MSFTDSPKRSAVPTHLASCDYFRSAERDGRLIEELEEVDEDELPEASTDEEDDEESA